MSIRVSRIFSRVFIELAVPDVCFDLVACKHNRHGPNNDEKFVLAVSEFHFAGGVWVWAILIMAK
jgi:hypothetical protein